MARSRSDAIAATVEALEANHVLVAELQSLEQKLTQEENRLVSKIQSIRRRMALRRAQQAMTALVPHKYSKETLLQQFSKTKRNGKKTAEGVPRSYIRQHVSFFTDEVEQERKLGRPKKKKKIEKQVECLNPKDRDTALLQTLSEPPANQDTAFLRAHSHESFVAGAPTIFTVRERKVVKEFAKDYYKTHDPNQDIPLEVWNTIHTWQQTKKARQAPIERTGFACKLWYELHESPTLRLCAWTKEEDAALRDLATGAHDPHLVNQWHAIATRMPYAGRPAAHCLIRYQTALCAGNTKSNFTPDEDEILRKAVPIFGEKWNIIADLLDGRVSEQIRHRWQLSLAPGLRRGKFSVIEDRRLLLALRAYVSKARRFHPDRVAWNDICHHVPGRTQPALRDRYLNCLNPELSYRKFTKDEDALILARMQEWGITSSRVWPRLVAELKDRTKGQVRKRWKVLDPEAFQQRRRALVAASKSQTTAVFRRRSIHRHDPRHKTVHVKRSSYNGLTVDETHGSGGEIPPALPRRLVDGHEPCLSPATNLQVRETPGEHGTIEYDL
ncbi:hypothetical protein PsorP6_006486 [Peronosclerospora sorghi]|uniref:Uncharacterized protein n=1 Tax=Peronosclerospora sorghi TaxID=230839 RepID=A0ACC0W6G5_9STRA|nr:hypothetical protein PsorP6_006486 [Peronosclerospora sorghi]